MNFDFEAATIATLADSSSWPQQRLELVTWFRENALPLAEAYEGAILLLSNERFPGRVHFIAHAVRDIADRLIYVLDPQQPSNRVQYENELDKIEKEWPSIATFNGDSEIDVTIAISYNVGLRINDLVEAHRARRKRPSNYELLFRYLMHNEPLHGEINQRLVSDFKKTRQWFMGNTHLRKEPLIVTETELQIQFNKFEGMMHSFVGNFFTVIKEIDEILQQTNKPTSELLEATIPLISSPQHERYFFSRLENPYWVGLLHKRKFFAHQPKAERFENGVHFPQWAPSKYLARMAKYLPAEVADIFAAMKTDNAAIIGDMIEAARAMPADVAATLVPSVCQAVKEGVLWIYFKEAVKLSVYLVKGGKISAAMTLVEALFTPSLSEGQVELNQMDEYWYAAGLKKIVPVLAAQGEVASKFLSLLCDWLKIFVQAMKYVDLDTGSDNSQIWRPAIEEHEQNNDYEFASVMVGFVREGFERAIHKNNLLLAKALEIVDQHQYLVFKRIRIHLINEFAEENCELVRQVIMDYSLFENSWYKHEYAMLAGKRLTFLTPDERKEWLGWIDAGPDMSNYDEWFRTHRGCDATDEDRESYIQYWQFEKLHWVRDHLTGERRTFYDEMLKKHGEPELADLNIRSGSTRWGNESPITLDALMKISFDEVVTKVSSWEPEEPRAMGPNIEGLASTFKQYVGNSPVEFSSRAEALVEKPAIFVREFISQMNETVKNGVKIDVSAVLRLCQWVVECPIKERMATPYEHEGLIDQDWQWTRDEICRFIENVCKAMDGESPKYPLDNLRQSIWQLLNVLCYAPIQSNIIDDTSPVDPRNHDYLTLGINSSRGKAVEAALAYAKWIGNNLKTSANNRENVPGGFASIPEVREMLEWQIAPDNRSAEALSIIGVYISLLYLIDRDWLSKVANQLFDLESIEKTPPAIAGWAAWNAFLVWGHAHIEFYQMFKSQFAYTVEQAEEIEITESSRAQPMFRLGEHLMLLYGRGQLNLDDAESLLSRFLTNSNSEIRRYAIRFVGQSLKGNKEVPTEIIGRFQILWEKYWPTIGKTEAEEKSDAYLFGTWFSSGQFPSQWALEQLGKFIDVIPLPEPNDSIMKQLAKISNIDIVMTIRILDRIIRADREGWRIHGWQEPAMQILHAGIESGNDGSRRMAVDLINYLGRRGYTDFGKLLD